MMNGAIRNTIINGLQVNKTYIILAFLGLLLLPILPASSQLNSSYNQLLHGAIVRGDTSKAELSLVFTGDEFADGGFYIDSVLRTQGIKASFFLTGKFYRNPDFKELIENLRENGHYLGAHSDQHLLYCSWEDRDSLLVSKNLFSDDMQDNYRIMADFGIKKKDAMFFLPPYEWYNDSIAKWTTGMGLQLINHTHGTLSHADYTTPGSANYRSSDVIYRSILAYENSNPAGLSLIHISEPTRLRLKSRFPSSG